jgi:AcrR family transcriptional regulator
VLDTALRLFNEHGYLGVRVEDITQQAGVSRATFYKHFAEREQILAELFERLLGVESAPVESLQAADEGTCEHQVVTVVEDAVQRMLEQEDLARFVYSLPVRHSALLRPGVPTVPPLFSKVTQLLERGIERGEVRDDLPMDLLARHALSALETAMRDWAEGRIDDPVAHLRAMLTVSFHGVAKRGT